MENANDNENEALRRNEPCKLYPVAKKAELKYSEFRKNWALYPHWSDQLRSHLCNCGIHQVSARLPLGDCSSTDSKDVMTQRRVKWYLG